jgi:SAM-dependent methyltransferase
MDALGPELLPFTAHRIELEPGVWTIPHGGDDPRLAASTAVVLDQMRGDLEGKRILDVGCLEGGYTVTFARRGAGEVVGVDIRDVNLARCRYLQERLDLTNVRFVKADVRTISRAELGDFDLVFASGILYHLEDPFDFLLRCSELTTDMLLLDTHIASLDSWAHRCSPELIAREWHGLSYLGRVAVEYERELSPEELEAIPWTAYGNTTSFWLTEGSLVTMLRNMGFPLVMKAFLEPPYKCDEGCTWECRSIFVAKKQWTARPAAA